MTKNEIEALAVEIRSFLLKHDLWIDTTIYFNGKAFSTDDRQGHYYYNDPDHLIVLEDQDPRRCFEYVGDILSMSFEGDFCGCLNDYGEYGAKFDRQIQDEFSAILKKHGLYYELGNHWNLTVYPI